MVTRHEFLASLHEILKPAIYLEIGVQYGHSLALARDAELAVGIDPNPLVDQVWPGLSIFRTTSDHFFATHFGMIDEIFEKGGIDLAFIDGMHLVENVWRDFCNTELMCRDGAVIVLDDVLPLTNAMASRTPCPGDWTGDVWKIYFMLKAERPDLELMLVDTFPTGLLVVRNLNPSRDRAQSCPDPSYAGPVPDDVINRTYAWHPEIALAAIREFHACESS